MEIEVLGPTHKQRLPGLRRLDHERYATTPLYGNPSMKGKGKGKEGTKQLKAKKKLNNGEKKNRKRING